MKALSDLEHELAIAWLRIRRVYVLVIFGTEAVRNRKAGKLEKVESKEMNWKR